VYDTDMPEAIVEYSTQQTAYETALRAASSIVQPSLMDFLK
jgi:flagellar hook-associated protein 3 FlgL